VTRTHRDRTRRARTAALAALLVSALVTHAAAAYAAAAACGEGISHDAAARLFAVLNHRPTEAECKFEGVSTAGAALEAQWSRSGTLLPPLRVVPRACAPNSALPAGAFAADVPAAIGQSCPSVVPVIADFLHQLAMEAPANDVGSIDDPLFRGARLLFAGIALLACALLARGLRGIASLDARWLVIGMASFAAALSLRAALPFSLGNWYSEVLPAVGPPPWMRFGPGVFAFQSLLRDAGLWSPRALIVSQLLLGAAAVPLLLGALWELHIGIDAAAATLVLLIVTPFHARLSATASEHVLASTLCVGLLVAWLRAARTGDWLWLGLTLLLFPAVCATRVDMAVQASLVLAWPLLRDRAERAAGICGWRLWGRAAVVALVAAATLAAAYQLIVLPSHHPLPEWSARVAALRALVPESWLLATHDPAWMLLPAVLLAAVGAASAAIRRPLLLARAAGTLVIAFGTLGRSFLPDALLGARYFLFAIVIFLIVSGQGFEALLGLAPEHARARVAALGIVVLGTWSVLAALPAYRVHYAFQDEYAFARRALAQLPDGCSVYQVPLRAALFPLDLDCCLDLHRSPLVLEFPHLRFRDIPDSAAMVFAESGCVAYYEGVVCQIADVPDDPMVHARVDTAADDVHRRCAAVRRVGQLVPLAETTTSPLATVNFFRGKRPHAGLYRWTP